MPWPISGACSQPAFTNVLKKFFTDRCLYENKVATKPRTGIDTMMDTLRKVLSRSDNTLIHDMIGGMSLVVILIGALHLPGF